ncbi:hypothetical protein [Sphingopyxis yananensis]|uniref:hypothetical protein n=1 Tax=Sphingopyxis yananensis TaxID=2886687 RepID=UPI001D102CA0|nr:hypothetical protein [Sphingopyxis yananensis]MCC2602403.1 hypothetical protein [Sphingopyxis yananensis]
MSFNSILTGQVEKAGSIRYQEEGALKKLFTVLLLAGATPVCAQQIMWNPVPSTVQPVVPDVYQNPYNPAPNSGGAGSTSTRIGDNTFHSDGSSSTRIGNQTFRSDGSNSTHIGNHSYHSDGSTSTRIGNGTYHSNGTTSRQIGNQIFNSDGTVCHIIGNQTICN